LDRDGERRRGVGAVDLPGGENVAASTATVTVQLNEENTRALIQEMPKVTSRLIRRWTVD
jgi:hypothetical protein